ncbi:S24 family peptidase [Photobacterium sp. SP02]|uniref:LexA family protein n=1 Tax=Photobacterium sp. SP02 TaxID=3032280 RepID=UPI0031452B81
MKKIEDLRLENARTLLKNFNTLADFADAIERSPTQMSRVIGKNPTKVIGSRIARHIEQRLGLEEGWLDSEHDSIPTTHGVAEVSPIYSVAQVQSFPLISSVQAGNWSEINEREIADAPRFPCPVPCGPRTFVLQVEGISMEPNFKDGNLIWVDPDVEPINKKLVVARLDDRNQATFKQLIIEDGLKMLKPLNKEWPEQYVPINGNCTIVGVVVFGGFIT